MGRVPEPTGTIKDRSDKLQFLAKDPDARSLRGERRIDECLDVNHNTFKTFMKPCHYKGDQLWLKLITGIAELHGFKPSEPAWMSGSFQEFLVFWVTHADARRSAAEGDAVERVSGAIHVGPSCNRDLIERALKAAAIIPAHDPHFAWAIVASAELQIGRNLARSSETGTKDAPRNKPVTGTLAKVRLTTAESRSAASVGWTLGVELVLPEILDTGAYIRKCRLVLKLDERTRSVELADRKRYPDEPRGQVRPPGLAEKFGLRFAPDDASVWQPAWALSLATGPVFGFTLTDLIELVEGGEGGIVSIEVHVSRRQFVNISEAT